MSHTKNTGIVLNLNDRSRFSIQMEQSSEDGGTVSELFKDIDTGEFVERVTFYRKYKGKPRLLRSRCFYVAPDEENLEEDGSDPLEEVEEVFDVLALKSIFMLN